MPADHTHGGVGEFASSKTMFGDLPPSSSVEPMKRDAALAAICAPVTVLPVNEILANVRVIDQRLAGLGAEAGDDVDHAGREAGLVDQSASRSTVAEVYSDGLITIVLPAHSAGASLLVVSVSGEFQGVIAPTTPSGSRVV